MDLTKQSLLKAEIPVRSFIERRNMWKERVREKEYLMCLGDLLVFPTRTQKLNLLPGGYDCQYMYLSPVHTCVCVCIYMGVCMYVYVIYSHMPRFYMAMQLSVVLIVLNEKLLYNYLVAFSLD